jgi:hypothetical protein
MNDVLTFNPELMEPYDQNAAWTFGRLSGMTIKTITQLHRENSKKAPSRTKRPAKNMSSPR